MPSAHDSRTGARWRFGVARVACLAALAAVVSWPVLAASPKDIKAAVDAAEESLGDGQHAEAAARLAEAARGLAEAADAGNVPASLRILARRCDTIRDKLAQAGVDMAGITIPPMTGSTSRRKGPSDDAAGPPSRTAAKPSAVSFSRQIAPLLVRSCGGCHVTGKKGDFCMPTYADLMRSGLVQRGAGEASRLVEVIVSGDMPRGGGKVSADEIATLVKWIDAGAAYDGGDPTLPLTTWGRAGQATASTTPKPPAADAVAVARIKPGEVSFASQVAPVLIESCLSCHGGFETENGFNLATFKGLLRGGRGGAAVEAGKSADSLLVRKLRGKGIDGQRMPLNETPLSDEVIGLIARWIDEGARLDVRSSGGDLQTIAAVGRAQTMSDADLAAVRRESGTAFWRQFLPDESPQAVDRGVLTLLGNVPASRMEAVAEVAGSAWQMLGERLAPEKPKAAGAASGPIKGGVVVYIFARPYDLSEFWLVRHASDRPRGVTASAGVSGDVVYAVLLAPDSVDESPGMESDLAFMVAEQMGAAAFIARGAPSWFAQGAGRMLAGTIAPRSPLGRGWRKQLPAALSTVGKAGPFFAGTAEPAAAVTVAGGFVDKLTAAGKKLPALLASLDSGAVFDDAFREAFHDTPEALFEAWAAQEAGRSRRR